MKKTLIELEVCTATQCSFIPFTTVPDAWAGKRVRIEVIEEDLFAAGAGGRFDELQWPTT